MAHCLASKRACSLAHLHQGQQYAAHCAAPVATVLRPVPAACRDTWLLGSAQHEEHHSQRRTRPALVMFSSSSDATAAAAAAAAAASVAAGEVPPQQPEDGAAVQREHCIVNFYHLVDLPDPHEMLARHRSAIGERDIRGRIYISGQGVNAQFGGPKDEALEYTNWVAAQPEFQGLRYSVWPAPGPMFPKLRLKYRPSLISLAGGMAALPITDPAQRAMPLEPAQWKEMIRDAKSQGVVVLDVRNSYEWDAGHFAGAVRPDEEVFNETPVGEGADDLPAPLKDADKDAPIMMYCTGGIRCDVYSAFLKRKGFSKMYTLHGGIQNYLVQEGGQHWNGSLFVFDGRMALSAEDPLAADPTSAPLRAAVPCQLCGAPDPTLPHMNCANIDCNELFIACDACKTRFAGCCCEECTRAPRLLRPVKLDGGHYGTWGNYADGDAEDEAAERISMGRSREGRVARRARRREACRQRREAHEQQQQAKKQAVREAMARLYEAEAAQQQQQQQQEEGGLSELQRRLLARRQQQQQQQQQETAAAR